MCDSSCIFANILFSELIFMYLSCWGLVAGLDFLYFIYFSISHFHLG